MAGNKCGQLALIKTLKEHKTSISELEGIERALGMTIGQQRTDTELMRILAELGRIRGFNIGLIIIDAISGVQKANSVISGISVNPTTCIVINHVGDAYSGHYEPITDEYTIIANNFHSLDLQSETGSESSSNSNELELALVISASLLNETRSTEPKEYGQNISEDEQVNLAMAMSNSLESRDQNAFEVHDQNVPEDEQIALAMAMSNLLENRNQNAFEVHDQNVPEDEQIALAMAMSNSLENRNQSAFEVRLKCMTKVRLKCMTKVRLKCMAKTCLKKSTEIYCNF